MRQSAPRLIVDPQSSAQGELELVRASPAAVRQRQRDGWLNLFADDARLEDPVGAAAYTDARARAAFWATFIQPQRRIEFLPGRDFAAPGLVVRQVVIETVTAIGPDPLCVPAIIEYRVEAGMLTALRAFWSPLSAMRWFCAQGVGGVAALARHNVRIGRNLGLSALLAFGRSLRPSVNPRQARQWLETVLDEKEDSRWRLLLGPAEVVAPDHIGLDEFPDRLAALGRSRRVDQLACAGREVAAVVVGDAGAAAVLIETGADRRIRRLRWVRGAPAGTA